MMKNVDAGENSGIAMNSRVLVFPGTDHEKSGVVVEDFADAAGKAVEIGGHTIVEAARRWAVTLDDGGLVFVDDDSLTAEPTD
ncbi:hypothetical protein [Mycolicibacterium baixiangningiae]|uniref:hypothetical protein n=1 Tax=Mycolicibacterium baixiangningiae TaxID=2761578 RepID=UPI0018683568|nr:hypothetical protein [Mycolicibacterium baixiangningiae]